MPKQHADERRDRVLVLKGTATAEATQELLVLLDDEDPLVREWAVEAMIGRRDREKAVPALIKRLQDERADLRWYAARALGKLGGSTDEVGAALRAALNDPDEYVRAFAAWAIGQLQFHDPSFVGDLRQRLSQLRRSSLEAQAVGVALARLQTDQADPAGDEEKQGTLFPPQPADPFPRELPKPKQAIIDELGTMALRVMDDRHGRTVIRKVAQATVNRIYRSVAAKEQAVAERGPSCQVCNFRFRKKDGNDYYEVHHVVWLSRDGSDDDWNLLVLCANHHRQMHYAAVEWPEGLKHPPVVLINGDRYPIRWTR